MADSDCAQWLKANPPSRAARQVLFTRRSRSHASARSPSARSVARAIAAQRSAGSAGRPLTLGRSTADMSGPVPSVPAGGAVRDASQCQKLLIGGGFKAVKGRHFKTAVTGAQQCLGAVRSRVTR